MRREQSEAAYVFGAVCAQHNAAVSLIMPHANTEAMAHHLEAASQSMPPGRHPVVVLNRAGWHTTPKMPQLPNLTRLPLRSGSPELNPAEQVWQQLHSRHLAHCCYNRYEQIVEACCHAWNTFTQIPGAIRSLCTRQWASLDQAVATS